MEEKKHKKKAGTTKVKMFDVVDLAIGGIERGEINVNIMKKLFIRLITKLEIKNEIAFIDMRKSSKNSKTGKENEETEVEEKPPKSILTKPVLLNPDHEPGEKNIFQDFRTFSDCGFNKKIELSCISIGSVLKGTTKMEENTNLLVELPEQYNLIRTLNKYEDMTPTILSQTWRKMLTIKRILQNEEKLSEVNLIAQQYREKMKELREFNDEIRKGVMELTKDNVDSTGRTKFVDPFEAVKKVLGKVNVVLETYPGYMEALYKAWGQMGTGTLPPPKFFDNVPSFCGLESLIIDTTYCFTPFEERKLTADAPPTKNLMGICLKLAQMIKYNEEKLRRLKSIEVQLDNLRLKNATKKEVQKLIERMAEVDGIGNATERLLCRVQKCEDLLCYLRQVVNKIYGCLTANPTTRYESEHIWACLLNPDENRKMSEDSDNLINESQMKSFQTQITKIDCEANIIEKSLLSVETIKVDVKNLFSIVNELEDNKLDKCVLISELGKKAEKNLVNEKVSQFCFTSTSENINSVINEILHKIVENDKESRKIITYLTAKVKSKSDMEDFLSLKEQSESKLRCLARKLITLHKFRTNNNLNNSTRTNRKSNKNVNAVSSSSKKINQVKEKILHKRKISNFNKNNNNLDEESSSDPERNDEFNMISCGENDSADGDVSSFNDDSVSSTASSDEGNKYSDGEIPKELLINLNNNNIFDDLCVEKNGKIQLNTQSKKLCNSLNNVLANLNYINQHIENVCKSADPRENKYIDRKNCSRDMLEGIQKMKAVNKEFKEKISKLKHKSNDSNKKFESLENRCNTQNNSGCMTRGDKRNYMFDLLRQSPGDPQSGMKDFKSESSIDEILNDINNIKLG